MNTQAKVSNSSVFKNFLFLKPPPLSQEEEFIKILFTNELYKEETFPNATGMLSTHYDIAPQ